MSKQFIQANVAKIKARQATAQPITSVKIVGVPSQVSSFVNNVHLSREREIQREQERIAKDREAQQEQNRLAKEREVQQQECITREQEQIAKDREVQQQQAELIREKETLEEEVRYLEKEKKAQEEHNPRMLNQKLIKLEQEKIELAEGLLQQIQQIQQIQQEKVELAQVPLEQNQIPQFDSDDDLSSQLVGESDDFILVD